MYLQATAALTLIVLQANVCCSQEPPEGEKPDLKLTPKVYSSLFVRRREEQQILIKHLHSEEKYEKRYKLIELGLSKIFKVSGATLT